MCIIIHRPLNSEKGGSNVPNDVLDYNRRINPDGFGIAWRDKDGLHFDKFGPAEYDAFHTLLKKIDKRSNVEYVAHFRTATHGPVCQELSHPFDYGDKKNGTVLVFHNGIIDISPSKGESDTSEFVKTILSKLPANWWTKSALKYLVESAIGYSRLLIMTETETVRFNERAWSVKNGIYYSVNPGPPVHTTYSTGGKVWPKLPASSVTLLAPSSWTPDEDDDPDFLIGVEEDDDDEESFLTHTPLNSKDWLVQGHPVTVIDISDDRKEGLIECQYCTTTGDFYVVDGKVYPDITHDPDIKGLTQGAVLLPRS